jgi:hypothetical protein
MRIRSFRFQLAQQNAVDPFGFVFHPRRFVWDFRTWHNETVTVRFDPLESGRVESLLHDAKNNRSNSSQHF